MTGYTPEALNKFQHPTRQHPQNSPHYWKLPNYVTPTKLTPIFDTLAPLPPEGIQIPQQIIGTLLYFARDVDPPLIVALGVLVSAQLKGTVTTSEATMKILDYCATHSDTCIRYKAISMVIYIHRDATYLSESQSRIRSVGHFYLSD